MWLNQSVSCVDDEYFQGFNVSMNDSKVYTRGFGSVCIESVCVYVKCVCVCKVCVCVVKCVCM